MCSPHGRNTFEITIALTAKSIIGAEGTNVLAESISNTIKFPDPKDAPGQASALATLAKCWLPIFLNTYLATGFHALAMVTKPSGMSRQKAVTSSVFISSRMVKPLRRISWRSLKRRRSFQERKPRRRLQDAVDGSAKDIARKAESLNAIKQRLHGRNELDDAEKIERFQNEVDHPYKEVYGAVALFENPLFDSHLTSSTDASSHPYSGDLALVGHQRGSDDGTCPRALQEGCG